MARFAVTPFNSLLLTFGLTGIIEALIQSIWTADFRKLESSYGNVKFKIGGLYVPLPELITLLLAVGISFAVWAVLRYTDLGKAMRAAAEDAAIAAAFGVDQKSERPAARRHLLGARRRRRRLPRAQLHARAVADLRLGRRGVRRRDARRPGAARSGR